MSLRDDAREQAAQAPEPDAGQLMAIGWAAGPGAVASAQERQQQEGKKADAA